MSGDGPRRLTWRERGIGAALGVATFVALASTLDIGMVRDEGHYSASGEAYNNWFSLVWDDVAEVRFNTPKQLWTGQLVPSFRGVVVRYVPRESITMRVNYAVETFQASEIASVDLWRPTRPRARVVLADGRGVYGEVDGDRVRTFYGNVPATGATPEPGVNAFAKEVVKRRDMWGENAEHPVFMKALFALSHRYLHERWGITNGQTAHRVPALVIAALLVFAIFAWTTQLLGARAGVFAAASFITMPHIFFHSHLATFDVPITAMWFFVVYAFWRSLWSWRWAIACGVIFGLALATKLNAFFLPIVIAIYYLARFFRGFGVERDGSHAQLRLPAIPLAFVTMAVLGPLIFIAHWPLMWHDTLGQISFYLQFHLKHEHYDAEFLGHLLYEPPWPAVALLFPFLMSFLTIPVPAVIFGAIGFLSVARRVPPVTWIRGLLQRFRGVRPARMHGDPIWFYVWINALIPFVIIALPSSPKFGGTKHWFPALPFVVMLAALAFSKTLAILSDTYPRIFARRAIAWALVAAVLAPGLLANARVHPFGTAYFNTFAGGLNGSGRTKTQRQFWGHSSRQVLDWLNKNAKPGAQVCTHKMNSRSWEQYRRDGIVRRDLVTLTGGGPQCDWNRADFLLYHWQKAFADDELDAWYHFGRDTPEHAIYLDGEMIVGVYKKQFRFEPEGVVYYGWLPVGRWDAQSVVAMRGTEQCAGARGEQFDALYERCFGTPYPRAAAQLQ